MPENDVMVLEQLIPEEDVDPTVLTLVPQTNLKAALSEDEFEIRRRAFFGIKYDAR